MRTTCGEGTKRKGRRSQDINFIKMGPGLKHIHRAERDLMDIKHPAKRAQPDTLPSTMAKVLLATITDITAAILGATSGTTLAELHLDMDKDLRPPRILTTATATATSRCIATGTRPSTTMIRGAQSLMGLKVTPALSGNIRIVDRLTLPAVTTTMVHTGLWILASTMHNGGGREEVPGTTMTRVWVPIAVSMNTGFIASFALTTIIAVLVLFAQEANNAFLTLVER